MKVVKKNNNNYFSDEPIKQTYPVTKIRHAILSIKQHYMIQIHTRAGRVIMYTKQFALMSLTLIH